MPVLSVPSLDQRLTFLFAFLDLPSSCLCKAVCRSEQSDLRLKTQLAGSQSLCIPTIAPSDLAKLLQHCARALEGASWVCVFFWGPTKIAG